MGGRCREGEYLDSLTRSCLHCRMSCQHNPGVPKCAVYCDAVLCEAKPGHYYDRLVRRCMKCAEICGKHPAECSPHCPALSPPAATKSLPFKVTRQAANTGLPPELSGNPNLTYALLAVCTVLLLSSLCLALVVLVRREKAKNSKMRPMSSKDQKQQDAVQPDQESGVLPGGQAGRNPKEFLSFSSYPTDHEPSEDSYPTETCVCVHCFPDLKGLGLDSNRLQRSPYSFYQQGILHRAHIQNVGSRWTRGGPAASGPEVEQEAAVG